MSRLQELLQNFYFLKLGWSRRTFWIGSILFFLGLFVKVTWEIHEDTTIDSLDREILILISKMRSPFFNGPAVDITAMGSPTVLTIFTTIGVGLLWLIHDRRSSVYLAIGGIGSGVGTFLLKHFFTRERPTVIPRLIDVSGFSYPSGHSLGATSFYLLLLLLTWKYFRSRSARIFLVMTTALMIGSICFSRLYLGVHYPSDVLSGILLGASWVCFVTYFFIEANPTKI